MELEKIKPLLWLAEDNKEKDLLEEAFDLNYNWELYDAVVNIAEDKAAVRNMKPYLYNDGYPEGTFRLNFLDNHDTMRSVTRCGSKDIFFQQLALLMTLPGSACIYYGTEIALEGGNDPDCRRPMPWDKIADGKFERTTRDVKTLIRLRRDYPAARRGQINWNMDEKNPRLIRYERTAEDGKKLVVYINAQEEPVKITEKGKPIFARKLRGKTLMGGGVAVFEG